jgi:rfaE bifunctional protein kinase chain/domain
MIIGDVMIDTYYTGKVDRISPEAPVPVVSVTGEESRLGGAANVARNIRALGASPVICSVIGDDGNASGFLELCKKEGIRTEGVIKDKNRTTTVKIRIIGNNHQLLRADLEQSNALNEKQEAYFISRIRDILDNEKIDVIIFEDYDKGVITAKLINDVIEMAGKKNIPTAADPKKVNFLNYKGISLFKPNLKELKEGLKTDFEKAGDAEFHKAVSRLRDILQADSVLITLSDEGVYYESGKEKIRLPAHLRNIADVSGAGDTVIAVAALCLALRQDGRMIASLSNLAGGLVCEKVGVVPVEKDLLIREAISSIKPD